MRNVGVALHGADKIKIERDLVSSKSYRLSRQKIPRKNEATKLRMKAIESGGAMASEMETRWKKTYCWKSID